MGARSYCGFRPINADGRSTHAKNRFTESQIIQILAEYNAGAAMEELACRNAVHANTIRLWRSKYAGMSASDLSRLKELKPRMLRYNASLRGKPLRSKRSSSSSEKTPGAFPASRSREGLARIRFEPTRGVQINSRATSFSESTGNDESRT